MSSTGSVLRWPSSEAVLEQARAWAERQAATHPDLEAVGVFGSYGRGDAGVGSDLDLLLILRHCDLPVWERLRRWDTGALPLATDLLVYSRAEWDSLPQWNPAFAAVLARDVRWLVGKVAALGAMKGDIEVAADFDGPLAEHFDALS
ncbi:nucleotidyltransferase domain-containing protein [Synechococcus sp. GFB01]|uniref:nucleotidyltransferase domain-containing protein n=1 Tax=Synechococcus sp. GFB01 TaxID=1662190 RepID=UPI0009081FE5|nr:nucleotidyltransferase domain-containing protein [Synechococcus sp. GFB01]